MTPGRYFSVGHQVGGHNLSDYLEEDGYSPLDAGRSSLTDLSSDLTPHHYDFRSSEDSCNYFYHYLCSPLSEIGGDHPENCSFGMMIVLPVPSCNLPNDYIRRCNRLTDHGTDSHFHSDDEDNYYCDPETCCCLHFSRNCDGYNRKNIDLRYRVFLSCRESNYPCCHEGCHPYLHCRRDGEQNDGHVSDHRVSRSCQCKISLPTQVYMFSIRRSRLYTSVCTLHVSMSCVAYRCTDPGP